MPQLMQYDTGKDGQNKREINDHLGSLVRTGNFQQRQKEKPEDEKQERPMDVQLDARQPSDAP